MLRPILVIYTNTRRRLNVNHLIGFGVVPYEDVRNRRPPIYKSIGRTIIIYSCILLPRHAIRLNDKANIYNNYYFTLGLKYNNIIIYPTGSLFYLFIYFLNAGLVILF